MSDSDKNGVSQLIKWVLIALPWVISMYTLYWLEYGKIWTLETPHRGKTSVAILLLGMGLTFFLYSKIMKSHSK